MRVSRGRKVSPTSSKGAPPKNEKGPDATWASGPEFAARGGVGRNFLRCAPLPTD
jgi:hypothetical protein